VELRSARSILRFGKLGYCEHQVKMRNLLEAIRADTAESTNQSRLSAQQKLTPICLRAGAAYTSP
jgi:hypothetical protein